VAKTGNAEVKHLLLILVIALILRVAYVLTLEDKFFFPDSERYDRIASDLVLGKGFSSTFTAPLYPVLLSWLYTFFGHSFLTVRIVHSIIGTASVLIIYLLAKEMFSEKAGLIAALLGSIYPFFVFFTGLVLTETLFTFLFLCFVLFLKRMAANAGWRYAIYAGIFSGLSILVKPVMAYFVPFALVVVMAVYRGKKLVLCSLAVLPITLFVIAPWALDNYRRTGKVIFLATGGGLTLYESNNPHATGGPGVERIVWTEEMKEMDAFELDRHFKKEALRFIKDNPHRFVELAVIKVRRFWSFTPNAGGYQSWKYKVISIVSYGPILILAMWQIVVTRRRWKELIFLYLPVIFFTLLHTVILGSLRYRLPIMPYVIMFAAGVRSQHVCHSRPFCHFRANGNP